jgi:hypothetical protein
MNTYESMSAADYQACADAGRGEPPDARDLVDAQRKASQEESPCPRCGEVGPVRQIVVGSAPYFVHEEWTRCGHVVLDTEGGV